MLPAHSTLELVATQLLAASFQQEDSLALLNLWPLAMELRLGQVKNSNNSPLVIQRPSSSKLLVLQASSSLLDMASSSPRMVPLLPLVSAASLRAWQICRWGEFSLHLSSNSLRVVLGL